MNSPHHRMKFPLVLRAVVLGLLACIPAADAATVNVVTWNIEWFPGRNPDAPAQEMRAHMRDTQSALQLLDPDVLLLQEIAGWQAAEELVSCIPGMRLHVVSQFHERPQNLVIASRLPVDSAWYELWREASPETPPRGFAFAALRLPDERFLLTYTVHYKSNHGDAAENFAMRQQSTRQLLEHAAAMLEVYSRRGQCLLVIGGDFNTSADDPRFDAELTLPAMKQAGLHWVHEGVPFSRRITLPARGRFEDTCFDHIFTSGALLETVRVHHFPRVSDHNPIQAVYRFPAGRVAAVDLERVVIPAAAVTENLPQSSFPAVAERSAGWSNAMASRDAISADDIVALKAMNGRTVKVHGVVQRIGESPSGHLQFINFGRQRGDLTAIVRWANMRSVSMIDREKSLQESLSGRHVEVRGRLELYNGDPQIELSRSSQIRFLQ